MLCVFLLLLAAAAGSKAVAFEVLRALAKSGLTIGNRGFCLVATMR